MKRLILVVLLLVGLGVGAVALVVATTSVPTPNEVSTKQATIITWADGKTELARLGDSTRRSVALDEIPEPVRQAVLAAEDRTFYEHGGISPVGIARAVWNNVRGESTQGGSTVTQQYAKNAFLTQDRSWQRKIREAILAFKLETVVSKDQILEDYLNTIYFGRGSDGIDAAARAYFGVPAAELDVAQGAVLASIIKSPNNLAPEENLEALRGRWSYVLDAMVEEGWLTPDARAGLRFPDVKPPRAGNRLGGQTGYLVKAVTDELIARGFDETEIQRGGLRITTTFERQAQRAATAAVRKAGPKTGTEGLRIGLAAVRPGTGEVIAMYGGRDFVQNQINNATTPFAQAGSTFKPFALAAATEAGIGLGTVWNGDSPQTINGYTLTNYGDKSYGMVTLLQATERSINTSYVQVESEVGVDRVADAALRAGIPETTPGLNLDNLDLTFVLGTASPSGLDVANAYATFAAQGVRAVPTVIARVEGSNGGLLYEFEPSTAAAFSAEVANTVTYALNKVATRGTGVTALALDRPSAVKTGTTDGNRSAWFAGYTPQLATAVLMAKEDAEGLPVSLSGTGGLRTVTGGSFPAAIWTAFMKAALGQAPVAEFPKPPPAALEGSDCPSLMPTDGTEIPAGCPTPDVAEFGPSNEPVDEGVGEGAVPSDAAVPGDPAAVDASATPEPTPQPTVDPQPVEGTVPQPDSVAGSGPPDG